MLAVYDLHWQNVRTDFIHFEQSDRILMMLKEMYH